MSKYIPFILFWTLGIIWGTNFIYMKWSSELLSEIQVVLIRVLFGFIPVFLYALYLKVIKLEHLKYSFHFFVMSLLGTSIYYFFYIKGAALLLSGVAGAVSGTIPLFTFILATIFIKEQKVTLSLVLGILIGFSGVVLISKPYDSNLFESNFEGIFYILLGSFILACSFVYAKRFLSPLNIHFAALTTYQLGFAVVILALFTDYTGIENILSDNHKFYGLIIGLGLLGTGITTILYYYLIQIIGPVRASSSTYIPPAIALFIAYFLVDENITFIDLVGTILIFSGVFLINKKKKP
ncbi:DMT family transporter [Aliarcobacter lanthieri]|uniref:DMT family transporter n=1 Tax=Aliarcobacter lanthieri TaxID=1355374 RepID=UPI00047A16A2|nr:DMT family transporter [Aliarcobacter lanthieri]QKF58208.1 EamA/RhaT family transporter [Aliarcobacter lanthieri]